MIPDQFNGVPLKISAPATYRIEVEGAVSESLLGAFENIHTTTHQRSDHSIVTILVVRVMDQAEFSGLLNTLYDWHLPIRAVKLMSKSNGTHEPLDGN